MTNQDWRNPDDYSYTAALGAEGWAWEFLRRNPVYRNDWVEIDGRPGVKSPWGLEEFYDPDQRYDKNIRFFRTDLFPIVSGFPLETYNEETETFITSFPHLMSVEEMLSDYLGNSPSDVLVIAVRAGKSIPEQITRIKSALEEHERLCGGPEDIRFRVPEYTRYLRMLDAVRETGGELSQVRMIEAIHPEKTWPGETKDERIGYDLAGDSQKTDYASETLNTAMEFAQSGYRRFIRRVQGDA
jgi:hypothetical protein